MALVDIADYAAFFGLGISGGGVQQLVPGGIVTLEVSSPAEGLSFSGQVVFNVGAAGLSSFVPQKVSAFNFDFEAEIVNGGNPFQDAEGYLRVATTGAGEGSSQNFQQVYDAHLETGWKNLQDTDYSFNFEEDVLGNILVEAEQLDVYELSNPGDMVLRLRLNELVLEGYFLPSDNFWTGFRGARERDL